MGLIRVEVSIKKISNKKTKSDIDEELKFGSILLRDCIITYCAGSCKRSINSIVLASNINTTLFILPTSML